MGVQGDPRLRSAGRGAALRRGRGLGRMPEIQGAEIERVFREEYGRAVAVLIRAFGDIDIAEEAVQDAFTVAHSGGPTPDCLRARPVGSSRPRKIARSTASGSRPRSRTATPRPRCC